MEPHLTPRMVRMVNRARTGGLTVEITERPNLGGVVILIHEPGPWAGWVQVFQGKGTSGRWSHSASHLPSPNQDSKPVTLQHVGFLVGLYIEDLASRQSQGTK